MRLFTIAAALSLCLPRAARSQSDRRPIELGEARTVHSTILNEDRPLLISLPESYDRTTVRYPVLYVLDGGSNFLHATASARWLAAARNRAPEMIVVAIPNTNRNRDMSPDAGAVVFERVLAEEIIPWVDANYRAAPERVVAGHSRSGQFVVHALLHRPELFQGYIALSAPLYRYDSLAQQTAAGLPGAAARPITLYLAAGDEDSPEMRGGMQAFADSVERKGRGSMTLSYTVMPDEHHNSVYRTGLYEGLEERYRAFRFPFFETAAELDSLGGLAALEAHYGSFSPAAGFPVPVPLSRISQVAQIYVGARRFDAAQALAAAYRERYPRLAEQLTREISRARQNP